MFGISPWMLIAGGVGLVVAFGAGWKTRDAFCDAARLKVENARLTDALRTASLGAKLAADLQTSLDTETDKTDELQKAYDAAVAGTCSASQSDVDTISRIMRGHD